MNKNLLQMQIVIGLYFIMVPLVSQKSTLVKSIITSKRVELRTELTVRLIEGRLT
jgi:hypothetical protein